MVESLIILSGAVAGIRDLWWRPDVMAVAGYMPFRSETRYGPWLALSPEPVPTERFRDQTTLTPVAYTVMPTDWTDQGVFDYWAFRCPQAPIYGEVIDGRALVASIPEHVQLQVDGLPVMAARVDGSDGTVWLPRGVMIQGANPVAMPYVTLTVDSVVTVIYQTLTNYVDTTPESRAFYTVVPVMADGSLAHPPGVQGDVVNIMEMDKMDWIQAREVVLNAWEFEHSGEPAHLLIRRPTRTPPTPSTPPEVTTSSIPTSSPVPSGRLWMAACGVSRTSPWRDSTTARICGTHASGRC